MARPYPVTPGVPAAGHISGGWWHPGPPATCRKGSCGPTPEPRR